MNISQFLCAPACVLDGSQVCLGRDGCLQHISKCSRAASFGAGRHGGSMNPWTCKQQVLIVPEPLRGASPYCL